MYTAPMIQACLTPFLCAAHVKTHIQQHNDVIINAFPKSGTTVMQQMCYQIAVLSGGAPASDPTGMEFADIAVAVPWIENLALFNLQENTDNYSSPRVFKTHYPVSAYRNDGNGNNNDEKNKAKHIAVLRNPLDFPASLLNFLFPALFPNVDVVAMSDDMKQMCVDKIIESFILQDLNKSGLGPWHTFVKQCAFHGKGLVLLLFYEDIVKNLKNTVRRVAEFMDCQLMEKDVAEVVQRCDRDYMASDPKFEGHLEKKVLELPGLGVHTFRANHVGFKQYKVSQDLRRKVEAMNMKLLGVELYEELRMKLKQQMDTNLAKPRRIEAPKRPRTEWKAA